MRKRLLVHERRHAARPDPAAEAIAKLEAARVWVLDEGIVTVLVEHKVAARVAVVDGRGG